MTCKVIPFKPLADPVLAREQFELGYRAESKGMKRHARNFYRRALAADPSCVDAFINLGVIYFERRRYKVALKMFEKAVQINNQHVQAWFNLGRCCESLDCQGAAVQSYISGLECGNSNACYNLAILYEEMGKHPAAMLIWQQYLTIGNSEDFVFVRQRISRLKAILAKGWIVMEGCSKLPGRIEVMPTPSKIMMEI